jgi:hypothetical protein
VSNAKIAKKTIFFRGLWTTFRGGKPALGFSTYRYDFTQRHSPQNYNFSHAAMRHLGPENKAISQVPFHDQGRSFLQMARLKIARTDRQSWKAGRIAGRAPNST